MRSNILINYAVLLFLSYFVFVGNTSLFGNGLPINASDVLMEHQWTLVELKQTKNDTTSNMTLFLMPCEKDNYIEYENGGNYHIFEGKEKCKSSDDNIKGEGTWEFVDQDGIILDSYLGGREVEKKVLDLDNERLVVAFESEGDYLTTLTYYSEIALQDEALVTEIDDNSNHSNNITQTIRGGLLGAGRYVLIGRRDFEKGVPLEIDDREGMFKSVMVYPFANASNEDLTFNETERNKTLLEQAAKTGSQYVVTGNLIQAEARPNGTGNYLAIIKYNVAILDANTGNVRASKMISIDKFKEDKKKAKTRKWLKRGITAVALTAGVATFATSKRYWGRYFGLYWGLGATYATKRTMDMVFDDSVDKTQREKYYKSSEAIMEALWDTEDELNGFVEENLPLAIVINEIEGKGAKARMIIEAGSNVNLMENERLLVATYSTRTLSTGKVIETINELGEVKVESVNGHYSAECKIVKGAKDIMAAYKDKPEDVKVITTGQVSDGLLGGMFDK